MNVLRSEIANRLERAVRINRSCIQGDFKSLHDAGHISWPDKLHIPSNRSYITPLTIPHFYLDIMLCKCETYLLKTYFPDTTRDM